MTKEELAKLVGKYSKWGFIVDKGARFWKRDGEYHLEVGRYWHSCHVDSTHIIVLLMINNDGKTRLVDDWHAELWGESIVY